MVEDLARRTWEFTLLLLLHPGLLLFLLCYTACSLLRLLLRPCCLTSVSRFLSAVLIASRIFVAVLLLCWEYHAVKLCDRSISAGGAHARHVRSAP